ncbi:MULTISPECIES: NADH:flavin oxidoreductase [unclassified Paenibacillus]|uniref:oxidoreductase n=1 Tax=unclassified Paenibacillus TaxID=185978 RepID=UPI0009541D26|nr:MULTISPECIES: NADH:flavin oxidoreductase [unclassified Paenibacillus]ASS64788.1 NADH:flavin oxidoreductase [Paenibacillus sp. RUD330]SIR05990.1 NADPH2 dehydrogenase [Paenibacillus sp. RU4X]SIR29468.1 NADPH2 dehydrogenase [Paenibacillus sp. RU4T]
MTIKTTFRSTTVASPGAIGSLKLGNRLMLAPLQQNEGTIDAMATDHHVEFYSSRAKGVGLVIVESTAVSADGRLYSSDIGIFTDAHVEPLRKVVEAVHREGTPVFVQLSHGGRKSWPDVTSRLAAPSALAYDSHYGMPEPLMKEELKRLLVDFREAARRSLEAGFDGIELHAAHGYLLHQFLSPLSNRRSDMYGGPLENRVRFIGEVLDAIREEVGPRYPVQLRVSASDFAEGGLAPAEVAQAAALLESRLDAVHVSAGGLLPVQPLASQPGYQVPYAAAIKQHIRIPVIAVGKIHTESLANFVLGDGLADFIALGSPMMEDADFAEKLLAGRG